MKKEIVVGLFLFVGLMIFGISIFIIKDIRLQKGYRLNLYFDDVGNLAERAWVRMRGVKIGRVERINIEDNKARVVVWIDGDVKLYKGSRAKISSTGVLGIKYVEMIQGKILEERLKDGDAIYETESIVSIDDAINEGINSLKKFGDLLSRLSKEEDLGVRIFSIINNIESLTKKIDSALNEQQLRQTVTNFEVAGKNLSEFLSNTKDDLKVATLELRQISEKLNEVVDNIRSTQTIAGVIISDKESGKKVAETLSTLKDVTMKADKTLNRINMFTTYWDYRLRYDNKAQLVRSDVGIEVYPKPSKYYYLSVNNISAEEQVSFEKVNALSLGIGGCFYDKFVFYGGLIRSYGGLGAKLFPLGYKSKLLEFNAEVFNFSKSRSSPQVDVGIKLKLLRWLYFGAKAEDVTTDNRFNTMLNLYFEDEDIAYLLGLIGLTR
ncbi:MAG: MlaD family protein [Endomicrobia bacterium]|nr:MlaD family protein [Endomicrobiia bacterium]